MPKPLPNITAAELRIMKILWRIGSGTVRDVKDQLSAEGDEQPAYTTVMTLLNQLAGKAALLVDKQRQPFVYRPAVRKEQVLGQRLKQFIAQVFDGQAGELVLKLVDEGDLSPEELRRIEKKIESLEQGDAASGPADASSSGGRA